MATPDDHKSSFPDDVYQDVKDWAAKQEAFEKENKAPAPLTDVQRMFLESFRPRPPLPDISQLDYISLLHRYRQANPTGKVITFADRFFEIRTAEGIPSPQWTCTVELSEALANAAKYAIDWLIKQSLMPSNLKDVTFLKNSPATRDIPGPQKQPEKQPNEGTNGVLSPPPKHKTKGTTGVIDVDDESLPATQRVQALCHKMGLNAPKYVLHPADPRVNYVFNGYPDFGDDEGSFPEDLGRIEGVSGRDNARQEIAEQVLAHLYDGYQEMAAEYQLFSESNGS